MNDLSGFSDSTKLCLKRHSATPCICKPKWRLTLCFVVSYSYLYTRQVDGKACSRPTVTLHIYVCSMLLLLADSVRHNMIFTIQLMCVSRLAVAKRTTNKQSVGTLSYTVCTVFHQKIATSAVCLVIECLYIMHKWHQQLHRFRTAIRWAHISPVVSRAFRFAIRIDSFCKNRPFNSQSPGFV